MLSDDDDADFIDMSSPSGRFRTIVQLRYGTTSPTEIARKLSAATGLSISRQNVSGWLKPGSKFIEPPILYPVSDALDVSARWLCAIDDSAMNKPRNFSIEEAKIIDLFYSMSPEAQQEWKRQGQTLVALSPSPKKTTP